MNRLLQMGNERAQLVVTSDQGYRWDGDRHPHSWSVAEESDVVGWLRELFASTN